MSLKRRFAAGVAWSVIGNGANNIISFVIFAIIARVVSPEILGIVAFSIVFVDFGKIISAVGIPALLVQRPEWDDGYAQMSFWVSVAMSIILALLAIFVLAPVLEANFAAGSGIVMTVLSACFIIDAIRIVHESKLRREFNYKRLAARGTSASLLSGLIGVTMALTGYGIWALVAQRVCASVFSTLFTWFASDWRPRFIFPATELRRMLVDGFRVVGAALLRALETRTADVVLGLFQGPVAVAVYRVGARGYEALTQLIISPVTSASLSGFSRVAVDGRTAEVYLRGTRLIAIIAYPVFFGSAAIAHVLVPLVFGDSWENSALVMTMMSLSVGPGALVYLFEPAMTSAGRMRAMFWVNVATASLVLIACLIGVQFGVFGVAIALAVNAHIVAIFYLVLLKRVVNVDPFKLIRAVAPAYTSATAMASAVLAVDLLLQPLLPGYASLPILIAVGGIVYPGLLLLVWRDYLFSELAEIRQMFPIIDKVLGRVLKRGAQD